MKQKQLTISKEQARRFILRQQMLESSRPHNGPTGVFKIIDRLGYVQIDTINVIERSHHIVLYTRCDDYTPDYLHRLQAHEKKIFEYWAHAASFVPMDDYRFYLRKMRGQHEYEEWISRWYKNHRVLLREVKKRIHREGSLTASDFPDIKNRKRGTWWDWKPAKTALEVLFWHGELMVRERRNFQRVYDLTERVLPAHIDTTMPSEYEENRHFIRRALEAMGAATIQDINRYIWGKRKLNGTLQEMLDNGDIERVRIAGLDRPYYILRKYRKLIPAGIDHKEPALSFLSPFDNAIILRDRTAALFDFSYALECYTPPTKRRYGYFCLPILWQGKLIGRIDPKADRSKKTLILKNVSIERKPLAHKTFLHALAQALRKFAHFHHCEEIQVQRSSPARYRKLIEKML